MEGDEENEEHTGQSFTRAEISYNIAQAFIMRGMVDKTIEHLQELLEKPKYKQKVESYISLLKDQNPSEELKSTTHEIEIFSAVNRLCGIYEDICITLYNGIQISFKLSFCLPNVLPPDPVIKVGFELFKDIKITNVENRPEAPWIKKNKFGLIFTNNVIENEVEEMDDHEIFLKRYFLIFFSERKLIYFIGWLIIKIMY